jgi:hypothetical protein
MSDNLRARSATEIVDAAVQLLRQNFGAILTVSGIGIAPWLVVQPLVASVMDSGGDAATGDMFTLALATLVTNVWFTLASAAIIAAALQSFRGEPVDVGAAIREVLQRPGAIVVAAFLKGLAVLFGLILFLVGAVYFYATYFAVPTTIMVEKVGGLRGVERSRELATGYRWVALKPLMLVVLIYGIITIAAGLIGELLFGATNTTLVNIFSTLITIFAYPIIPITEMLVYYDLRIRKEGYDVEMMASKLDPQGA